MGEAGRDGTVHTCRFLDRFRRCSADSGVEGLEPVPGHGGFKRVIDDGIGHGQFTGIGHADEHRAPGKRRALVRVFRPPWSWTSSTARIIHGSTG